MVSLDCHCRPKLSDVHDSFTIRRWYGGPYYDSGNENFMKLNLVANCIDNCFSDQSFHSDSDQSLNVHWNLYNIHNKKANIKRFHRNRVLVVNRKCEFSQIVSLLESQWALFLLLFAFPSMKYCFFKRNSGPGPRVSGQNRARFWQYFLMLITEIILA